MKFIAETDDLRRALKSVLPHASRIKDDTLLHRVRITIDPENVSVTATNRSTAALAIASLLESEDGEAGSIDLHPQDVLEVLALFKGRRKSDDEPDDVVQFEVTGEHLTITDISGLFPGKALTLPRHPTDDQFHDVADLLGKLLLLSTGRAEQIRASGLMLSLFAKAAGTYGQPLIVDMPPTKDGALLITCGESFIGLMYQMLQNRDDAAQVGAWREAWTRRIGMALGDQR